MHNFVLQLKKANPNKLNYPDPLFILITFLLYHFTLSYEKIFNYFSPVDTFTSAPEIFIFLFTFAS